MTILKICEFPDPVLRQQAAPVDVFDEQLDKLAADMAATMFDAPGVGLAAPQIGKSIKMIVVDHSRQEEAPGVWLALVNPEIVAAEGRQCDSEGCLSVPELTSKVNRHRKVTVRYQNLQGQPQEITAEDRFAVVLQHEIDHLNGVLFLDHLSSLKRHLYLKKYKKWLEQQQN
ncbi:MAG: peptide deformylase [Desulfobulbaceae bacterium]|jgi:peptide deformylase|nr:peptide deformylase [Desulfobulbaceae bacterium]